MLHRSDKESTVETETGGHSHVFWVEHYSLWKTNLYEHQYLNLYTQMKFLENESLNLKKIGVVEYFFDYFNTLLDIADPWLML